MWRMSDTPFWSQVSIKFFDFDEQSTITQLSLKRTDAHCVIFDLKWPISHPGVTRSRFMSHFDDFCQPG